MFYRKYLPEKAATVKRSEYSSLGLGKDLSLDKELKAQTDVTKKYQKYKKLDDTFEFYKIIKKEKPTHENYSKSNLIYDANHSFYKFYRDSKKFNNISFKSKYSFLTKFFKDLNKFNKLKTQKEKTKKDKDKYV